MTAEREAMTLDQVMDELRQQASSCVATATKFDLVARMERMERLQARLYAMSDAIDAHLSRAAEPVYQVQIITDEKWGKNEWREVTYSEFMDAKGRPFRATRILYTHPPGPARDAPEVYLRNDMLNLDIADSVENQFSIMVRRDGLISYAAYFHGDRRYGKAKGREFVKAFERWMDNTAMKEGE